jgi:hypothetical protein
MMEQIRKRLENGFTPFVIGVSDGRRFEIPHRDFIAISARTLVVIDKDELAVSIKPPHVVSVEDARPTR